MKLVDDLRSEFEAAYRNKIGARTFTKHRDGRYVETVIQTAWIMWQEARNTADDIIRLHQEN